MDPRKVRYEPLLLTVVSLLYFSASFASAGTAILYVDANATSPPDGLSWCTAFRSLDDALSGVLPNTVIQLAGGTYTPSVEGLADPRDARYELVAGVTIRGGFAGCGAPNPEERDASLYPTVLSGDLLGNDTEVPSSRLDNVYNVLWSESFSVDTVLDGVVISGGNATDCEMGCDHRLYGGALHLRAGSPTFVDCRFVGNRGEHGGAIFVDGGNNVALTRCVLESNESLDEGGAVYNFSGSLHIDNSLFRANRAASDGGAIFSDLATVRIKNTTFVANESESRGGALYNYVGVELDLDNSIVWGNVDAMSPTEEAQIFNNPSNLARVDFSCVEGWTGMFGGEGNFGDDPLFVLSPENLRLSADSPCRDAGDTSVVTEEFDLDGSPRVLGDDVDMGCYEFADVSGVEPTSAVAHRIVVRPSPFRLGGRGDIWVSAPVDLRGSKNLLAGQSSLRLHDSTGRTVGMLPVEQISNGELRIGRDSILKVQPGPGVYWLVPSEDSRGDFLPLRLVITR